MHILHKLEESNLSPSNSIVLTIGFFDGVHKGHATVLKQVQQTAALLQGASVILSFENHPSEILTPHHPILLLSSFDHRIKLIKQNYHIDQLILLPFTAHLAKQSAVTFIERVRTFIPFSHLILGYDAAIGKNRNGDRTTLQKLASTWGFNLEYVSEYRYEGAPVSSTRIRELLQQGHLEQVEDLLGRPYSIYSTILRHRKDQQKKWTEIDLDVTRLCLPPDGLYVITLEIENILKKQGLARIERACPSAFRVCLEMEAFPYDHQKAMVYFHRFLPSNYNGPKCPLPREIQEFP